MQNLRVTGSPVAASYNSKAPYSTPKNRPSVERSDSEERPETNKSSPHYRPPYTGESSESPDSNAITTNKSELEKERSPVSCSKPCDKQSDDTLQSSTDNTNSAPPPGVELPKGWSSLPSPPPLVTSLESGPVTRKLSRMREKTPSSSESSESEKSLTSADFYPVATR